MVISRVIIQINQSLIHIWKCASVRIKILSRQSFEHSKYPLCKGYEYRSQ